MQAPLVSMLDIPRVSRTRRHKKNASLHSRGSSDSGSGGKRFKKSTGENSMTHSALMKRMPSMALSIKRKMHSKMDLAFTNKDISFSPRRNLPEPIKLPEDPSLEERQKEREAMQEKLDEFKKFKRNSKKIVREQ